MGQFILQDARRVGMQNYGKLLRLRVNNILYRNFGLVYYNLCVT